MSSTTQVELTNQHFSVDPEGKQVVDLTFASEALGIPTADGYGWAQFEFGDQIGPGNRYIIARKLGWGMHSSTWLARDSMSVYRQLENGDQLTPCLHSDNNFVAVKALTGHVTDMYERAVVWEVETLRLI
jgi:hypothetical protein